MSYNIAIVNYKLPENFQEACDLINPLTAENVVEIESIYKDFHSEITKKFPCLCELSDDEIDEGIWSDGPLIDNFTTKAPVIGFSYSKVEEAFPEVGKIALSMGLSILDWQSETVYNP